MRAGEHLTGMLEATASVSKQGDSVNSHLFLFLKSPPQLIAAPVHFGTQVVMPLCSCQEISKPVGNIHKSRDVYSWDWLCKNSLHLL